ncbi:hypothetical protein [Bacillus thuringiensis]|nr:hypothetical protein [Bacillus thuringiensis]
MFIRECLVGIVDGGYEELERRLVGYEMKGEGSVEVGDYIVKERGAF